MWALSGTTDLHFFPSSKKQLTQTSWIPGTNRVIQFRESLSKYCVPSWPANLINSCSQNALKSTPGSLNLRMPGLSDFISTHRKIQYAHYSPSWYIIDSNSAKTHHSIAFLPGFDECEAGSKLGNYHVQGVHTGGTEPGITLFLSHVPNAPLL